MKKLLLEGQASAVIGPSMASPVAGDDGTSNQPEQGKEPDYADHGDTEEFQHSTPEQVPSRKNIQQPPSKKENQQQQLRSRPERTGRNPERGCKPERSCLKKPWENPKPRTRSKSRDRAAARTKSAAQSQGNKLNTSQGFNDTFDFDCEEAVHITPFKAKVGDSPSPAPVGEEAPLKDPALDDASPPFPQHGETVSSWSPSSESDDSLYVPQKSRQTLASPSRSRCITTRRGHTSKVNAQKENILPQPEKISSESRLLFVLSLFKKKNVFLFVYLLVFIDEPSPKTKTRMDDANHQSAEASFSSSLDPGVGPGQHSHQGENLEFSAC